MTADRDPALYGDDTLKHRLLDEAQVWAVVGLSNNIWRAAYSVAEELQQHGKTILPVHPAAEAVHGQTGYRSLTEAATAVGHIDVVDIFVNSDLAGDVVDDAIAVGAGAVWLQLGVIDEEAAARARSAGLATVMHACPSQLWARLRDTTPGGS